MMKRRMLIGILLGVVTLSITGCGAKIYASDEQLNTVSEYAAIMLLKYDANNRSRLVDEATIEEADRRKEAWEEAGRMEVTPSPAPEGMNPVDDTPVKEKDEPVIDTSSTLEEYFGISQGITMQYTDYVVCESYPQNAEDYLTLEASEGKKLLVLKFQLMNNTSEMQEVDLFAKTAKYKITVNGNHTYSALRTLLMNDVTTYVASLSELSGEEVVLITEIEDEIAGAIQSIEVYMKNDLNTYTIQAY